MIVLTVILIVLLLVLVLGVLYFLLGGNSGNRSGMRQGDRRPDVPHPGIVTVHNATSRKVVIELDMDELGAAASVPFYADLEFEEFNEKTLLEKYMDPATPLEEKQAIEEELRDKYLFHKSVSQKKANEENSVTDFSGVTDINLLFNRLSSPYVDEKTRFAIQKRIDELRSIEKKSGGNDSAVVTKSGEDDSDNDDDGSSSDGLNENERPTEGYVDPLDFMSPHQTEPTDGTEESKVEEPVQAVAEVDAETAEVLSMASDSEALYVCDFGYYNEPDDNADSVLAIELMKFIADSFRKGYINEDLVAFAQDKLNLQVNSKIWEESRKVNSKIPKIGISKPVTELESMTVEEFDLHVREEVGRETGSADAVVVEPVTVGPAAHGGKHELLWQRLKTLATS